MSKAQITARLERGLALIAGAEYFEAHEELELAWRAAEPGERDFFQGLVHFTVAWYQARRGNRPGCERQLEKAARRLGPYSPMHRGVNVAAVLAQVEAARRRVSDGFLDLEPVVLDAEADRVEGAVQINAQPPEPVEEQEASERD